MRTLRSDVLVLGSTLGGLVAATYLARAGLRVVLLEEQVHTKRPPLLREPFLISGLAPSGRIHRVLRELALPLIEQREMRRDETAVQVILPNARIDVRPERDALADELHAHGLATHEQAASWLEALDLAAERAREALWEEPPAPRGRSSASGSIGSSLGSSLGRSLVGSLGARPLAPAPVRGGLPTPPATLDAFVAVQLAALSGLPTPDACPAPALLLCAAREGIYRMPHGGAPFLDLFRRRFLTLHGEVWPLEEFTLVSDGNEVGIEVPRSRCFAAGLILAGPREPLRQFLDRVDAAPAWLKPGPPVIPAPGRLFRADSDALPVGLGSRVIVADGTREGIHCLARSRDPSHEGVEWLVVSGPGAAAVPEERPLGALAPFPGDGLMSLEPGPEPQWDLDAGDLRFPAAEPPLPIRHRALVATVGPELAPGLGLEGEILQARRVALRLAHRLGARRGLG